MDLGLTDDSVIVTASTSGLGLASAQAFADEGANVAVCGRTETRVENARSDLTDRGTGSVLARTVDITDQATLRAFVAEAADQFGGIDHLVTSAGGVPSGQFRAMNDEDWYQAYDLLVMSHVWAVKAAYPHLDASPAGTITAITSTSVAEAIDGLVLSNAVRRAVLGSIKTIAREFAPSIRANAVLPGPHETSRLTSLFEQAVDRGEYATVSAARDDWTTAVPLDRLGTPRELGDVVAFLASRRASFVTGVGLPVDGGRLRG